MIISEKIYEIMKSRGLSQKEFALRAGIAQSTVSDWKTKHINPSADKIMTVCEVLKVSPYELLRGTEQSYNQLEYTLVDKDTEEYSLLEQYRGLSLENKEKLAEFIKTLI